MTVSALVTRNDITATASQTSFTYTFRVLEATDMDVYQNGALLASGYTVNDVGVTTGGTVTLDVGVPVGQIVSLVLAMPLDRTTNYQNSGDFLAGDVNGDFDKIYIGAIQNENEGGRSLRLQDVEPPTAGVDMTIPLKADRLGKFLAFDDVTGGPIVSSGTGADAYDSAAWSAYNFTGNGSTTAFVLGISPHSENNTQVYIDGVYQQKDGYSLSASTITFSVAPPNLSTIEVMVTSALAVGSTSSDLVSYLPAGTGAVATTVQTKLRESVSVKDFGAVGNGTTDDTLAIQAAIDYVSGTGIDGTVIIPKSSGKYIFTAIVNKSNVTLKGTGGVLKLKDNTCINAVVNYYPIGNIGASDVNCKYDSLIIDGNASNNTLFNVADAITCTGKFSSVLNCKITDAPDSGIMFSDAAFGICSNNEVSGATDVGIYSNGTEGTEDTEGMIVTNNRIENCVYVGIAVKRSGIDYIVTNNTIVNCGNGITLTDFGLGTGGHPNNILISNNYLKDIGYPYRSSSPAPAEVGITAQICDNVSITNNILKNVSGVGINIDGSRKCIVTGNLVVGYTTSPNTGTYGNTGILTETRSAQTPVDCIISSNLVRDVDDDGIYLKAITYSVITNNIIKGAGANALRLFDDADNNMIQGNIADGATDLLYNSSLATGNVYGANITPDLVGTAINGIRRDNVNATPVSNVVPRYAGEFYYVTTGSKLFFATGTTNTDWIILN